MTDNEQKSAEVAPNTAAVEQKSTEVQALQRRIAELSSEINAVSAACDMAIRRAEALEAELEAAGADGVQALSAAPSSPWSRALEIRMAQGWKLKGDRIPVLYTDTINGEGVGRDDLWLCTTKALAASPTPTPSVKQTAITPETEFPVSAQGAAITSESGAVYAPMPRAAYIEFDGREETAWHTPDQMRNFADRTHALRMEQAATKAVPAWADQAVIEYRYTVGTHWCPLGPAERMKPDFQGVYRLQGGVFPVEQSAPKAAPGEQNAVSAEWLEQAYREGWAACRDAETIGEEAEDWAFGNSTANSRMIDAQQAAPQQQVQEPVFSVHKAHLKHGVGPWCREALLYSPDNEGDYPENRIMLYTATQPAPAPLSDDTKDAAFEAVRKKLCALPRYSFVLDDDGLIRRVQDRSGNWIEFDDAHELFDPIAVDAARKQGANHD